MKAWPTGSYDYLAVGHVTLDVFLDDEGAEHTQPGGGALYSGLQASRLGLRTLLVTRGEPRLLKQLLAPFADELTVEIVPTPATSTFETSGSGSSRRQRLRAWAGPIAAQDVRAAGASILHLAPVARETPRCWEGEARFVGITPQGLLRRWSPGGEIELVAIEDSELPAGIDALVISEGERSCCSALLDRAPLFAITAGEGPTEVRLQDGSMRRVAPAPVPPRSAHDDLGAGDVFAAAFFVALHEGRGPLDAAAFGNAAAAVRIAGEGPDAIGDREAITRRLQG